MASEKKDYHFALLSNVTARVIYYSCLVEAKGIPEIAKIWDYKTSTYFYQEKTKELLNQMEKNDLVTIQRTKGAKLGFISSNFDLIFSKEEINEFFEVTNEENVLDLIEDAYDYEISREQLRDDDMFRQYCIEKKPDLKRKVDKLKFTEGEIETFVSLWKRPIFRRTLLSADFLKSILGERRRLPQDPRVLLFSMTTSLCEDIYEFLEETYTFFHPNPYLYIPVDEMYPILVLKLEPVKSTLLHRSEEFETFKVNFKNVYKIFEKRARILEEEEEERSLHHLEKFLKLMDIKFE